MSRFSGPNAQGPAASSGFVADDAKEQIRRAIDIVDLIGSYLQLRRQGRAYVATCPWHDDSRPSLQVNPERQAWRCWVCNIGGDIFSFVMQREGVEFREAMQLLADRAGVSLKRFQGGNKPQAESGSPDDKATLFRASAWVEEQYHRCLCDAPEAEEARRYLDDRGISEASIEAFRIGYAPNDWDWIQKQARGSGFSSAVFTAAGICGQSESGKVYDRFRGRVIFPIRDSQGRSIAFGGRIMPSLADEKSAKYINSPESRLFSKSEQLYGLDKARDAIVKQRAAIVMEGYTDVVMAHQCGVTSATAVLGTALGPRHLQLLQRFADKVILILDGDAAGQRRTNEILELFIAQQADLRIVTLPENLDPCDFLLQRGADALHNLASVAVDALEHKIRIASAGIDPAVDLHGVHRALEDVIGVIARAPRFNPSMSMAYRMREEQALARLARQFRHDPTQLRTRLTELRKAQPRSAQGEGNASQANVAITEAREVISLDRLDRWQAELLELLIRHPEGAAWAVEQLDPRELGGGPGQKLYATIARIVHEGGSAEFSQLMDRLEDPAMQNLLVALDEAGQDKPDHNWEIRLHDLFDSYRRRREDRELQHKLQSLDQTTTDKASQLDVLQQLIEQQRARQGFPAPTDG